VIKAGDTQWMIAGSGIFHSEMTKQMKIPRDGQIVEDPEVRGFQLWVNLPSERKMTVPKYMNLTSDSIQEPELNDGTNVRIIAGEISKIPRQGKIVSSFKYTIVDVHYLDISMPSESELMYGIKPGYTAFAYITDGKVVFDTRSNVLVEKKNTVLYDKEGDVIHVRTGISPVRFLLVCRRPINEPIACYGTIVMNTQE